MPKSTPTDAPFVPKLCAGCTKLDEPCGASALHCLKNGNTEITLCGMYAPSSPPADPAKE